MTWVFPWVSDVSFVGEGGHRRHSFRGRDSESRPLLSPPLCLSLRSTHCGLSTHFRTRCVVRHKDTVDFHGRLRFEVETGSDAPQGRLRRVKSVPLVV